MQFWPLKHITFYEGFVLITAGTWIVHRINRLSTYYNDLIKVNAPLKKKVENWKLAYNEPHGC